MISTVSDLLMQAAEKRPDKDAVFHKETALSYAQIYEKSRNLAGTLMHLGVKRGDRVCLYMEKRMEKVIAIFAISLVGAVFVPIRRLSLPSQAVYIIQNCQAALLITTSSRLEGLSGELDCLKAVIALDLHSETAQLSCPVLSWEESVGQRAIINNFPTCVSKDIAAILYTSGSTGKPKGVVLNHQNIVAGARVVAEYMKITENDRLLSILAFGFDYGLNQLTTSFLNCAQLVLFDYLFPKDILKTVEKYQITGLAAVATTWIQLLQIPWGHSMACLRYVTNSGGAIPVKYVRELRRRIPDADIYLMYGLTEAFRSTYLEPDMVDQRPDSIGKAVPGEEIMVLDPDGRQVNPGEEGELVHRGVLVAQGYWGDPERTAKRFRKNPFHFSQVPVEEKVVYSGDFVTVDHDGYLYFRGRKDEMIKCSGNRISPTEVEEILHNCGFVAEVVALGVPHEIYGQVVCVVLSLLPDTTKTERDILDYCRGNMPVYMVPHEIQIWETLPRNTNSKLDRAVIRKKILSDADLRR